MKSKENRNFHNTFSIPKGKKRWSRISLLFQSLLLLNREEVKPIDDAVFLHSFSLF